MSYNAGATSRHRVSARRPVCRLRGLRAPLLACGGGALHIPPVRRRLRRLRQQRRRPPQRSVGEAGQGPVQDGCGVGGVGQGAVALPQSPPSRLAQNASATAPARAGRAASPAGSAPSARLVGGRGPRCRRDRPAPGPTVDRGVQSGVGAPAERELGEQRRRGAGFLAERRSTSSALTLPEPSQIELSGASRYSRGITDSSTYPLPPRHSSASAANPAARLATQYLPIATPIRRNACSASSPRSARSAAPASRSARVVAASDSTARSASTLRISGLSISGPPNAARCLAW